MSGGREPSWKLDPNWKLKVPAFGMDGNPESLQARREAYARLAFLDSEDWADNTELIDCPTCQQDMAIVEEMMRVVWECPEGTRVKLWFRCVPVPYSRTWVTLDKTKVLRFVRNNVMGGIWNLEDYKVILPRQKFKAIRTKRRFPGDRFAPNKRRKGQKCETGRSSSHSS